MDTLSASFSTLSIQTEPIFVYTYECTAALAVDADFVSSTRPSLIEYRRRLLGIVEEADEASKCGLSVSLYFSLLFAHCVSRSNLLLRLLSILLLRSFIISLFLYFCLSSFSLIGIVVDYSLQLCHHHPLVASGLFFISISLVFRDKTHTCCTERLS